MRRFILTIVSVLTFLAVATTVHGWVTPSPWWEGDYIARHTPREAEGSLDDLAKFLGQPQSEASKARAIFRWMTERIRYNADAHFTGTPGELRPENVLGHREATAFGYANLFESLARRAGLEAVTIHGYAKMKHHTEEGMLTKVKHAWNAVRIDGQWYFVDTCWGSGYLKLQRWHRVLQEQYFLAPPPQMILTHLPLDPRSQLLNPPVSPEQFDARQITNAKFLNLGVKTDANHQGQGLPEGGRQSLGGVGAYAYLQAGKVKLLSAPAPGTPLTRAGVYYFVIEGRDVAQMAMWNNGVYIPMTKVGTRFEGGIMRLEPGEMRLCLQRPGDAAFQTVLTYRVGEK